jgi:monomeric isocitrate dehydrogenase
MFGMTKEEKFSHHWEQLIRRIHAFDRSKPSTVTDITVACNLLVGFTKKLAEEVPGYKQKARSLAEALDEFRMKVVRNPGIFESRQQLASVLLVLVKKNIGIDNWPAMQQEIEKRTIISRLAA